MVRVASSAPAHPAPPVPPAPGTTSFPDDDDMPMPRTATQPPADATPATAPAPVAAAATPGADAAQLDIAFCCDCTGSMGAYIKSAQENIRTIAQSIHDQRGGSVSVRYALVKYRDHPPQDNTFVTEVYAFTKNINVMQANVDTMSASGGGDGPEAVAAALHEVNELDWRANATKVCVFIADAPPHGLGENGDGFPQGCPQGHDPVQICKALAAKGVVVYAVGVEPVLSTQYKFARDFMIMVAKGTEGRFLPLGKAAILSEVIVGGALEGIELKQTWEKLEADIAAEAKAKNEAVTDDELCNRVEKRLAEQRERTKVTSIEVENPYMNDDYDMMNAEAMLNASSLMGARAHMSTACNEHVAQASAGYAWSAQQAQVMHAAPMSMSQCSRAVKQARNVRK